MAKPKSAKVVKSGQQYSITLQIGDKTYTGKGESALAALINLEKPEKIMYKAILTITKGALKKSQMFLPVRAKRLFYSPLFQQIAAKQLEVGMK